MKKLLLTGSIVLVLGFLIAGFTTPLFAYGPGDSEAATVNTEAWEDMHEACENGDWEAMVEAAEEAHGDDFDDMPYHGEGDYSPNWWGGMGSHMDGSMMGW